MNFPGLLGHNNAAVSRRITLITIKFQNKSKFQFKYFTSIQIIQIELPKYKTY